MPKMPSQQRLRLNTWYLKQVPFPAIPFVNPFSPDPLLNGSVFDPALRQDEIAQIRDDILQQGFANSVMGWSWLWAKKHIGRNLGMGKTALLAYVTNQINHDYGQTFFHKAAHWLAVYAHTPPEMNSLDKMMAAVLGGICNTSFGKSVDQLLLASLRHKVIKLKKLSTQESVIKANSHHFAEDSWLISRGVDLATLTSAVEEFLIQSEIPAGIAKALAGGKLREYLVTLNGTPDLMMPSARFYSQASTILTEYIARAAYVAELQHITIFLDDFYYLARKIPTVGREDFARQIRMLSVNGSNFAARHQIFNWVAVMHTQTGPTLANAWDGQSMNTIAPLTFNTDKSLVLRPLPFSKGRMMLEAYLKYKRIRKDIVPSPSFPFTAAALERIAQVTGEQYVNEANSCDPRALMAFAHQVITEALSTDYAQLPIDVVFVEHVLQGKPLPEIPPGEDSDEEVPPSEEVVPERLCICDCHAEEQDPAHDIVVIRGGSTKQDDERKILGYFCKACYKPAVVAQV